MTWPAVTCVAHGSLAVTLGPFEIAERVRLFLEDYSSGPLAGWNSQDWSPFYDLYSLARSELQKDSRGDVTKDDDFGRAGLDCLVTNLLRTVAVEVDRMPTLRWLISPQEEANLVEEEDLVAEGGEVMPPKTDEVQPPKGGGKLPGPDGGHYRDSRGLWFRHPDFGFVAYAAAGHKWTPWQANDPRPSQARSVSPQRPPESALPVGTVALEPEYVDSRGTWYWHRDYGFAPFDDPPRRQLASWRRDDPRAERAVSPVEGSARTSSPSPRAASDVVLERLRRYDTLPSNQQVDLNAVFDDLVALGRATMK